VENPVLVTGGAGYVGSHVCKLLARADYTPVTFDSLEHGHRSLVRWGPLEVGDLADRGRLDAVMRAYRPRAVLHFAAYAYVGESMRDPGRYYRNNVGGTLNLLDAMVGHEVAQLVFSSTCATFGIPQRTPIDEEHPQVPINPYGASKLMVERILRDYEAIHGLRSVALRYFNAAGADPDGEVGELHDPETHLIPLVLDAAAGTRPAVEVYGDDYPTRDGSCVRDYVHVSDLADAHVRALDHLATDGPSAAFNLGTGTGSSVFEVIEQVHTTTGRGFPVDVLERRAGDPPELVAATGRATTELRWRPERSGLAEIVEDAWRWRVAPRSTTA
jgi:UDP-arabinose 4-epimerase